MLLKVESNELETLYKINIKEVKVEPKDIDGYATIKIDYLTEENVKLDAKCIKMEGEDYDNWTDEDDYLINWVLTELSLSEILCDNCGANELQCSCEDGYGDDGYGS